MLQEIRKKLRDVNNDDADDDDDADNDIEVPTRGMPSQTDKSRGNKQKHGSGVLYA